VTAVTSGTKRGDLLLRVTVAVLLVAAGFFAVTLYVETRLSRVDPARDSMAENALPSIRHLSTAWSELHRSEQLTLEAAESATDDDTTASARAQAAAERRDSELELYASLPYFPAEKPLYAEVRSALAELDAATRQTLLASAAAGALPQARQAALTRLHVAGNRADGALDRLIDVNVTNAQLLMREVRKAHEQADHAVVMLDALALIVGVALAVTIVVAAARLRASKAARDQLMEQRASELEAFSARVAHDILSPLGAVSLSLDLARRPGTAESGRMDEILQRGQTSLGRARDVVDALLEFARSGARPGQSARCQVAPVIEQAVEEARITHPDFHLELQAEADVVFPCSSGVVTSLVTNLMNNAFKYGHTGERKELRVRALRVRDDDGGGVRLEVEDGGPGIPEEAESRIFLPYHRAAGDEGIAGLGLGLATVRKLTEAHGGRGGVRARPGQGATFWVTFPVNPGEPPAEVR
jgi:signal transduction histidine kinase